MDGPPPPPLAAAAARAKDTEWLRLNGVGRLIALTQAPLHVPELECFHLPPPTLGSTAAALARLIRCCELVDGAGGRRSAIMCARGPEPGGASAAALVAWLVRSGLSLVEALMRSGTKPRRGALAALLSLEWSHRGGCSDLGELDPCWSVLRWEECALGSCCAVGDGATESISSSSTTCSIVVHRGRYMRLVPLSRDPLVTRVEGFLSLNEAEHVISLATPELHPSRVARVQPGSEDVCKEGDLHASINLCETAGNDVLDQGQVDSGVVATERVEAYPSSSIAPKIRTSWSCALGRSDGVLATLVSRTALLCGLSPQHAEEVQVVRYRRKDEYKEHCDYFSLQVRRIPRHTPSQKCPRTWRC